MSGRDLDSGEGSRRSSRWWGLLAVAVTLVRTQLTTARGRTLATILVVALTVANLVLVTGVALALADDGEVEHDADARIVADDADIHGSVTGVEPPRLGESPDRVELIADRDGVAHASPVLREPIRVDHPEADDSAYLLLVGVVPGDEPSTVAELPTAGLEDEPAAADDTELVLSRAAAAELGVEPGEGLFLEGVERHSATVSVVEEGPDGEPPVALVEFAVLQSLSGTEGNGLADEVLIWGEDDAIREGATEAYPDAALENDGTTDVRALFGDGLALATSVLALVVALGVCSLLVATTAGMRVEADRRTLATLGAVGFPTGSRLAVVATTTLATATAGALLGVALGVVGIRVTNAVATATVAPEAVATLHPLVVPYALAVAVVSTLVALPYPLALAARTDALAEVGR
ncbi:FtsX-like permease family protein [Natronococcus sp. A-GB7]|uniref:FtsX-like permease family protein n=1 Tax=Natronococcus sp. A-GB7 TaxID=3037649 RepID=UPI00241D01F7|nr:FtsX-like permease family protein [Natronococcus sp. A-GB7]MDG5818537.1 ABC transporter permease [Natronococcus sp. A-GB7]